MKTKTENRQRWVVYVSSARSAAAAGARRDFFSVLEQYTPWIEDEGGCEAYLELGGVRRLWGHPFRAISRIQEELFRKGIPAAFGLGSNKILARSASVLAGEGEVLWILPGGGRDFLEALALELLPEAERSLLLRLRSLGIRRAGDLSLLDPFWIRRVGGDSALLLRQRARGLDPRPVIRKLPAPAGSTLPLRPFLFPPEGRKEKLDILTRLAAFFRRKYGGKAARMGPPIRTEVQIPEFERVHPLSVSHADKGN